MDVEKVKKAARDNNEETHLQLNRNIQYAKESVTFFQIKLWRKLNTAVAIVADKTKSMDTLNWYAII